MVELRALGQLHLLQHGEEIADLARRSKRVGLLLFLAVAQPRGFHRRDRLLAMFWPELDARHARAALNQSIYVLRAAIGTDALEVRGDADARLDPGSVWCDVHAFEAALDAGRLRDAMALYRGDLLEAFYIADAPAFEHWLDSERARLRARAAAASWALAEEASSTGNFVEARSWGRRGMALAGDDEAAVERMMRLEVRAGNPAEAARLFENYARELRAELSLAPSARLRAFASGLRAETGPASQAPHRGQGAHGSEVSPPVMATQPAASPVRRASWAVLGLTIAAVAAISHATLDRRPAPVRAVAQPRVLVRNFSTAVTDSLRQLGAGMAGEIASLLTQVEGLRVVGRSESAVRQDSTRAVNARVVGATHVLEGTVTGYPTPASHRLRVVTRLIRLEGGDVIWSRQLDIQPVASQVLQAHRDIAHGVTRALGVDAMLANQEQADLSTLDLGAYLFYLRGLDYYRRSFNESDIRLAAAMFERAVAADSTFGLAWARLSSAHSQIYWFHYDRSPEQRARAHGALQRALSLQAEHPDVQIAVANYHYWCHLAFDRALAALDAARRARPHDSEIFEAIGNVRRRQGDFRGALASFATAAELEPASARLLSLLSATFALAGDRTNAETYFAQSAALYPEFALPLHNHARFHLSIDADLAVARHLLASQHPPADDPSLRYLRLLVEIFEGSYSTVIDTILRSREVSFESQWQYVPGELVAAQLYDVMGRTAEALAFYGRARAAAEQRVRKRPSEGHYHSALAIAYAGLGLREQAVMEARKGVELMPVGADAWRGLYRLEDLARVYTMIGDTSAALSTLETLEKLPGGSTVAFLTLDPAWRPLRSSPRFQELESRRQRLARKSSH